jgi:hypothetical protein
LQAFASRALERTKEEECSLIFAREDEARVISSGDKSRAGFQGRRLDRQGALREAGAPAAAGARGRSA